MAIIGLFAHVDAGKTTLAEQILFKSGLIRKFGSVDKKNTLLDHNNLEKERGITIFADEASFKLNNNTYFLIDTPGHIDFSGEMERSILAIDCAILIISAVEGIESHSETIYRLLKKHNKPIILFINKSDRNTANTVSVLNNIQQKWTKNIALFNNDFFENSLTDIIDSSTSNKLLETLVSLDEHLLEDFFEDSLTYGSLKNTIKTLIHNSLFHPVIIGSAINGIGIDILFNILTEFFPVNTTNLTSNDFSAMIYKIRHDKSGNKISFIKILSGCLFPKQEISISNGKTCKINELRRYNGNKFSPIPKANSGEICAVTGLLYSNCGEIIGKNASKPKSFSLVPLIKVKVIPLDDNINISELFKNFKLIESEEPLLLVSYNEEFSTIHIQTMGEIQLQTLKFIMKERFNINIDFGESEILYKETISNKVIGCGHFEPLRHYAEVHLMLETAKKGSGISFSSNCSTDLLSKNWQNLIKTHVFEKTHRGVLTNSELCDIHITLLAGKAHEKHTEGGDFRQAVYRAIRQGLMQADNILLEPYYFFKISVDLNLSGKIITDIEQMYGKCNIPTYLDDTTLITGICPVSTMQNYASEFHAKTKGKGILSLNFDSYYPCHNSTDIIKSYHYNPENDIKNTPDSVFCSHGSGYLVKWSKAKNAMHIKL